MSCRQKWSSKRQCSCGIILPHFWVGFGGLWVFLRWSQILDLEDFLYIQHRSHIATSGKSVLALAQDQSSELNFCSLFTIFWFAPQVDLDSFMDETKSGCLPQPLVDAQFTAPVQSQSAVTPPEMCIGWMSIRSVTSTGLPCSSPSVVPCYLVTYPSFQLYTCLGVLRFFVCLLFRVFFPH